MGRETKEPLDESERGARDQTAKIISIIKQQGSPRITSTSALLIMPNPLTVSIITIVENF